MFTLSCKYVLFVVVFVGLLTVAILAAAGGLIVDVTEKYN
jgi:hypothetical protein